MRPKFQHENSYACLLAEVLEEGEEKTPAAIKTELASIKAAKQSVVDIASSSVERRRRRRLGAAAAAAATTPSTISTSTSAASSSSAAPAPAAAAAAPAPPPPPPPPLLVEVDDASLPEVLKFNRFIQTGYRRAPLSGRECWCSVAYAHNESFNVLSHLVPLVLVAVSLATGAPSSSWPSGGSSGSSSSSSGGETGAEGLSLLLHALPVLLCLAGSVCYHLFMADSKNYSRYLSVDVCGILMLTVAGTRAMASRPARCAVRPEGSPPAPAPLLSLLLLLRRALVSPWAGPPSSPPPPWSSISRAAVARDGALASYAALVVFAANRALRGRSAAERGLPLLALLLARAAALAARAAEFGSLSSPFSPEEASLRSSLG